MNPGHRANLEAKQLDPRAEVRLNQEVRCSSCYPILAAGRLFHCLKVVMNFHYPALELLERVANRCYPKRAMDC